MVLLKVYDLTILLVVLVCPAFYKQFVVVLPCRFRKLHIFLILLLLTVAEKHMSKRPMSSAETTPGQRGFPRSRLPGCQTSCHIGAPEANLLEGFSYKSQVAPTSPKKLVRVLHLISLVWGARMMQSQHNNHQL